MLSEATGTFYEKVLAITGAKAQLTFVNRGQGWVMRKVGNSGLAS
jgi:Domain of unknown function (DUF6306)